MYAVPSSYANKLGRNSRERERERERKREGGKGWRERERQSEMYTHIPLSIMPIIEPI